MKKNKILSTKILLLGVLVFLGACAKNAETSSESEQLPQVPSSWHQSPEDSTVRGLRQDWRQDWKSDLAAAETKLGPALDEYIRVTDAALETLPTRDLSAYSVMRADKVPWHLEYFMTDMSISAQGLLGGLFLKGTPAVTFNWRKQYPKVARVALGQPQPTQPAAPKEAPADLVVNDETTDDEIVRQLEPAVRAAVASGQVNDRDVMMRNLLTAAKDFQNLTRGLDNNSNTEWWASRLRLDLSIDASGSVTPFVTVGGDLRLRFEWHRIMKKVKAPSAAALAGAAQPNKLGQLVRAFAEDLSVLTANEQTAPQGFEASSFRVGLGVTAKGDLGIAKASASVIGYLYFSRNAAKPIVNPKPNTRMLSRLDSIPVIDETPAESHIRYASENQIPVSVERGGRAVFQIPRDKIRDGLRRAKDLGSFFGKHADTASMGQWKVYEVKTGFDLSLSGSFSLVEITGLATAEISFYNRSF